MFFGVFLKPPRFPKGITLIDQGNTHIRSIALCFLHQLCDYIENQLCSRNATDLDKPASASQTRIAKSIFYSLCTVEDCQKKKSIIWDKWWFYVFWMQVCIVLQVYQFVWLYMLSRSFSFKWISDTRCKALSTCILLVLIMNGLFDIFSVGTLIWSPQQFSTFLWLPLHCSLSAPHS